MAKFNETSIGLFRAYGARFEKSFIYLGSEVDEIYNLSDGY